MTDRSRYKTGSPPSPGLYKTKWDAGWYSTVKPKFSVWNGHWWSAPHIVGAIVESRALYDYNPKGSPREVRWKSAEVKDG